ncbi:MAG TPA: ROK family protein, partial [Bacillales bacterium]|nr:ROK family protein [Bacillales bacterium]
MISRPVAGAIDIGGTKSMVGIVSRSGEIIAKDQFPTDVSVGARDHIQKCLERLSQCLADESLSTDALDGIGVAAPGLTDTKHGVLLESPYSGWRDVPIRQIINDWRLGLEVRVANDVNACASGELLFGYGKTYHDFLWVTISTGIGGALVLNDRVYEGKGGIAGEIGHIIVEWEDGIPCGCGNVGCLEAHGSGTAIARMGRERLVNMSKGCELSRFFRQHSLQVTSENIARAARESVESAKEIFYRSGKSLGKAFS